MKKINKIGLLILFFILISTNLSYADMNFPWNFRTNNKSINTLYDINKKEIIEESEFYKVNIEFPYLQIINLNNRDNENSIKIIQKINDKIYKFIYDFKEKIEKESEKYRKQYQKEFEKQGYTKFQYDSYIDYSVTYNKNNLLSIPITAYEFTGGAHGLSSIKSFNYDLSTGKSLELEDIFKEGVDYKKIINSYINEEINKNKDFYFTGKEGFKGITDNQEFYLDKNSIVVYFSLYEIAPYYIGIPKFIIPYKDIEPYLKIQI